MEEGRNWPIMSPAPEEDFKSEDMAVDSRFNAFRLDKDIAAAPFFVPCRRPPRFAAPNWHPSFCYAALGHPGKSWEWRGRG